MNTTQHGWGCFVTSQLAAHAIGARDTVAQQHFRGCNKARARAEFVLTHAAPAVPAPNQPCY
eukprot:3034375-Prymnesium_polylepis.1